MKGTKPLKLPKRLSRNLAITGVALLRNACSMMDPQKPDLARRQRIPRDDFATPMTTTGRFWQKTAKAIRMPLAKNLVSTTIREEVALGRWQLFVAFRWRHNTAFQKSWLQDLNPDFRALNMLEIYDAMALGNHDSTTRLTVLKKQKEWAGFLLICQTFLDAKTGKNHFLKRTDFIK